MKIKIYVCFGRKKIDNKSLSKLSLFLNAQSNCLGYEYDSYSNILWIMVRYSSGSATIRLNEVKNLLKQIIDKGLISTGDCLVEEF